METVEIRVPVTPAAAELLRDATERKRLGMLLSLALTPGTAAGELSDAARLLVASDEERRGALREAFADMQRAAAAAGLTPSVVEEELAARKEAPAGG